MSDDHAVTPAAVPASQCQFLQPPQTRPCPLVHPMDHTKWCGACLLEKYEPERFAQAVVATSAPQPLDAAALIAEVERFRAPAVPDGLERRIDLSLRLGQILGPDYDGVSLEDVARELVALKAVVPEGPRLRALACEWARMQHCDSIACGPAPYNRGHVDDRDDVTGECGFNACPHPDCVLVRSESAPAFPDGPQLRALSAKLAATLAEKAASSADFSVPEGAIRALVARLWNFTMHKPACTYREAYYEHPARPCTCGLSKAVNDLQALLPASRQGATP